MPVVVPRLVVAFELQPLQLVDAQGFEGLLDHGGVFQPPQTARDVVLRFVGVVVGSVGAIGVVVVVRGGVGGVVFGKGETTKIVGREV